MKLDYTCEKSETETLELAMRPFKRWFRTTFAIAFAAFAMAAAHAVADKMEAGLVPQGGDGHDVSYAVCAFAVALTGMFNLRRIRRGIVDTCRARKTNKAEYRLDDAGLFCAYGEWRSSVPWSAFAKFRIDPDALFLWLHNGYVVLVPDWGGRGVDGAELAAVLERAGLKRMDASRARRAVRVVLLVLLFLLGLVSALARLHEAREHRRIQLDWINNQPEDWE